MPVNNQQKFLNQKREYRKRRKRLQDYQQQLKNMENTIKEDFNFIKTNLPILSSLTQIEKLNFKKRTNRYYRNKDYVRFLKRKIERNIV